jgi:hypothetical protein
MKKREQWIRIAAIAGIAGCAGDLLMTFIMALVYPGYNQFTDTLSKFTASESPVRLLVASWWIVLSILFIVMATGFRMRFDISRKSVRIGYWLIVIYALGEGMGSGIFPADHIPKGFTLSLIIHDTLGGIGIAAIMLLPFILRKQPPFAGSRTFRQLTWIVLFTGPVMLILFSLAKIEDTPNFFIFIYKGLWQRLLMFTYYAYLIGVSIMMWTNKTIDSRDAI